MLLLVDYFEKTIAAMLAKQFEGSFAEFTIGFLKKYACPWKFRVELVYDNWCIIDIFW